MKNINIKYDSKGLVPAIIQNSSTLDVLMLGYMNNDAYKQTVETGVVTFFSRSKNRLWVKGEASNNKLIVDDPGKINSDPEEKSWFFKIKIKDKSELDSLMSQADYEKFVAENPS